MTDLCCYCYASSWEKTENNFHNFGDFTEIFLCRHLGTDDGAVTQQGLVADTKIDKNWKTFQGTSMQGCL